MGVERGSRETEGRLPYSSAITFSNTKVANGGSRAMRRAIEINSLFELTLQ
jgi:hypothetical protein